MINVYLSQVNYSTGSGKYKGYWFPYSVGTLWSYVNQFSHIQENFLLKDLFFKRDNIQDVIDTLENPGVFGFSCYVWNYEYNKKFAKTLKEQYPECKIIFGGPQVSKKADENFFLDHPYIDAISLGEGEENFKKILEDVLTNELQQIYQFSRVDNLDFPSPYLTNVFDSLIEKEQVVWNAVLETNRGCPFKCTYCDWGSLTYAKIKQFPLEKVYAELEWIGKNKVGYVTIADANFGVFKERDLNITNKLREVQNKYQHPETVDATWYKNLNEDVLNIVKAFIEGGFNRGFSLSLQSLNAETLVAIERSNMKLNKFNELLNICNAEQIPSYTELILGLPYETSETWKQGLCDLIDAGQHNSIESWLTQMLENSELNNQRKEHGIQTVMLKNYYTSDENIVEEKAEIVNETKYMSFSDLVDSWMYSWMITNLHVFGWTQVVSIFLNKNEGVYYREFYDRLFDFISHTPGILKEEFENTKHQVKKYLSGSNSVEAGGHNLMWKTQEYLHKNHTTVFQYLAPFFNLFFKNTPPDLHFTVLQAQQEFVTTPDRLVVELSLEYNVFDHIFKNEVLTKQSVIYKLEMRERFENLDDYYKKFYFRRRQGWGKYKINRM